LKERAAAFAAVRSFVVSFPAFSACFPPFFPVFPRYMRPEIFLRFPLVFCKKLLTKIVESV